MILIIYMLILMGIILVTKKRNRFKDKVLVGYNLLFFCTVFTVIQILSYSNHDIKSIIIFVSTSLGIALKTIIFDPEFLILKDMFGSLGNPEYVVAQLWIISFISLLCTANAVIIIIAYESFIQFKFRLRRHWKKEQFIILGCNKEANYFIKELKQQRKKALIIFIPKEPLDEKDALHNTVLLGTADFLKKIYSSFKPRITYQFIILTKEDKESLYILQLLDETVRAYENSQKKITIRAAVLMDNDIIRYYPFKVYKMDAYITSREKLFVEGLLKDKLPIKLMSNQSIKWEKDLFPIFKEPFTVCVIGYGSIGQEYLLSSFENSAFLMNGNVKSFKGIVFDNSINLSQEKFLINVPFFRDNSQIEFYDCASNTKEYFDILLPRLKNINQILIETGNTGLNVQTGISLNRMMQNERITSDIDIIVCLHEKYPNTEYFKKEYKNLRFVNVTDSVYNFQTLVEREMDAEAKKLNTIYNERQTEESRRKDWGALDVFTQNSNRAVALDQDTKKIMLERIINDIQANEITELLAQYEHQRWMSFHFAHGWMPLPIDELTEQEILNHKSKRQDEKGHLCLTEWKELDKLPPKSKTQKNQYKNYDRDEVRYFLHNYLKNCSTDN